MCLVELQTARLEKTSVNTPILTSATTTATTSTSSSALLRYSRGQTITLCVKEQLKLD